MLPLPNIAKPAITPRQKGVALTLAGGADLLQIIFFPMFGEGFFSPFEDALDLIVATLLIAICGFRWQFALAFFLETVPGLSLFPTWTAVVLMLSTAPRDWQNLQALPENGRPASCHPPISVTAVAVPPVQAPPIQSDR